MNTPTLKRIIEGDNSTESRSFALVIQILIIISALTFSLDTLPYLSGEVHYILSIIETITVAIFTVEYLLRVLVADKKLKLIFSIFGLIDLISILPFYIPTTHIDLRTIRIFRLFRLARIFKLFRYNQAIKHFNCALVITKEELILFGITTMTLLYLAGVGIYYYENTAQPEVFKSVLHGLWWGITTLTTLGDGNINPITIGGTIFTFFILILGLGIVAVPTGLVSTVLTQARNDEKRKKKRTYRSNVIIIVSNYCRLFILQRRKDVEFS